MEERDRAADARYIWGNAVQSPLPICMFYVAHPFSSCPSAANDAYAFGRHESLETKMRCRTLCPMNNVSSSSNNPPTTATTEGYQDDGQRGLVNEMDRIRLASFIPWPRETFSRESSISAPLTDLAKRNGHQMPDDVLRLIKVAWRSSPPVAVLNTPRLMRFNSELALNNETREDGHADEMKKQGHLNSPVIGGDRLNVQQPEEPMQTNRNGDGEAAAAVESGGKSTVGKATTKRRHQRRFSVPESFMRRHDLMLGNGVGEECFELHHVPCCLRKSYGTEAEAGAAVGAPATTTTSIDSFIPCCCDSTINSTPSNTVIDFRQGAPPNNPPANLQVAHIYGAPTKTTLSSFLLVDNNGFLNVQPPIESPSVSPRQPSASSVISESVLFCNCCSRLYSAKRRLTLPMDYFNDRPPQPPRSPRHNNNPRHYRSMFLTSDDNSLLTPGGNYSLPTSDSVVEKTATAVTLKQPNDQKECVVESETNKIVATAGENYSITPSSRVKASVSTHLQQQPCTMVARSEQQDPHTKHQHQYHNQNHQHCHPHLEDYQNFGTKAEVFEQRVLSVNYNPTRQLWSRGRVGPAATTVVTSSSATITATVEQPRSCAGCECERKIDQYISEMLIENLNSAGLDQPPEEPRMLENNQVDAGGDQDDEQIYHYNEEEEGGEAKDNNDGEQPLGDIEDQHNANEEQPCPRNSNQGPHNEAKISDTCDNVKTADDDVGGTALSTDRLTYIPCYTNERNEIILGPVTAGSVYPDVNFDTAILVPRLSAYPRSESMEVRSSASEERQLPQFNLDSAEENHSLVDSLDGSALLTNRSRRIEEENEEGDKDDYKITQEQQQKEQLRRTQSIENATTQNVERPEAFFIPIGRTQYQEDLNISKKMPPTIREKLNLRQRRRNFKREQDLVRKNHTKLIETGLANKVSEMKIDHSQRNKQPIRTKMRKAPAHSIVVTKYHPTIIPLSPPSTAFTVEPAKSSQNRKAVRDVQSDIGLLKSYTIDSKGNMQFQAPAAPSTLISKGYFAKIATLKTNVNKKLRKKGVFFEHQQHQKQTLPFTSKKRPSDSLTLYRPEMNLTPEIDKGPRRIYQKTEIQDGEKRIEILEIVECASSSNSNSMRNQSSSGSRIPRPVLKIPKNYESASQTPTTCTTDFTTATSTATATASSKDLSDSDQLISEMLIENMKTNNFAPEQQTSRRPPTGPKFTQMFEVIPEEKSSALSHDSTTERSDKESGGRTINNAVTSVAPPKRLSAFMILDEDSAGDVGNSMESFKQSMGSSSVIRKIHRTQQPARREYLPKTKQVREPTLIMKGTGKLGGERRKREQRVAKEGQGANSYTKHQQQQPQKPESNYNTTTRSDSRHYPFEEFEETPPTTTATEEEEEEGVEEEEVETEDLVEDEDKERSQEVVLLGKDNDRYFKDYHVSNEELEVDDKTSSTVASFQFKKNGRKYREGGEDRYTFNHRKELSIGRTQFESICGESNNRNDTHSVCVQTEADPSDAEDGCEKFINSKTHTDGDSKWMESAEYNITAHGGDIWKKSQPQNRTESNGYKYPDKETLSSTMMALNSTTAPLESISEGSGSYKNVSTDREIEQQTTRNDDVDIKWNDAATEINTLLPKDAQNCTITARTTENTATSSLQHDKVSLVSPRATNVADTSVKGKASQVGLNVWGLRQEDDARGREGRFIKQSPMGESGQLAESLGNYRKVDESDDIDTNNINHSNNTRGGQYENTCSRSCQFCPNKSLPEAQQSLAKSTAQTSRCCFIGTADKPKPSSSAFDTDFNAATARTISGKLSENNCPTTSCSSTGCLNMASSTECCCFISCCSSCHPQSCLQSSLSLCGCRTGSPGNVVQPSENSSKIASSTSRHSRSTTTKSLGNNQIQKSTRSSCERRTREFIKSVRPDEVTVEMGRLTNPQVERKADERSKKSKVDGEDHNNKHKVAINYDKSKRETGMDQDIKNTVKEGLCPQKPLAAMKKSDCTDFLNSVTKDAKLARQMNRSEINTNNVVDHSSSGEENEDFDKSTPDTVINNGQKQVDASTSASCSSGRSKTGGVIEWARRKKRKVQHKLNEENQRSIVRQSVTNKNINRDATGVEAGNANNGNGSWSVTVAGSYHPDMAAPDLQMRLSFPGTRNAIHSQQEEQHLSSVGSMNWNEAPNLLPPKLPPPPQWGTYREGVVPELDLEARGKFTDEEEEFDDHPDSMRQVLPVIDTVAKRKSLMRAPLDEYNSMARAASSSLANGMLTNQTKSITKRTSRKSIKHIDCNVAVESATTRTISRVTKGQRALAYHHAISAASGALGTRKTNYERTSLRGPTSSQSVRTPNHRHHQKGHPPLPAMRLNETPVDSSRLWLDSNQSTRRTEDLPCLSVNGNAIAPGAKPRVPTMSEKDLTRRHSSCFTRSRPFYA